MWEKGHSHSRAVGETPASREEVWKNGNGSKWGSSIPLGNLKSSGHEMDVTCSVCLLHMFL